jgi:hypothetical protein
VNSTGLEEEAKLNIHQTVVSSGRRCWLNFLGESLLCRGEVSIVGILSTAWFQNVKFIYFASVFTDLALSKPLAGFCHQSFIFGLPQDGAVLLVC